MINIFLLFNDKFPRFTSFFQEPLKMNSRFKLLFLIITCFLITQGSGFFFFQRPEIIEVKNGNGRPNLIRLKKNTEMEDFCNEDYALECLTFPEVLDIKYCLTSICSKCYKMNNYKKIVNICKLI
uniref:ShKT domain-containing protein n=1 Tax=Strongyloides papillosus TaxID=174720 RepID=A0A0N5B2F2_STREA